MKVNNINKILATLEEFEQNIITLANNQNKYEEILQNVIDDFKIISTKISFLEKEIKKNNSISYQPIPRISSGTKL